MVRENFCGTKFFFCFFLLSIALGYNVVNYCAKNVKLCDGGLLHYASPLLIWGSWQRAQPWLWLWLDNQTN